MVFKIQLQIHEMKFGFNHLQNTLTKLGYNWTKAEIEQMIWEVDEDLDEQVDINEFKLMYKRCTFD